MGAAEGTFDFDLELKKRSSLVTILDKNSYSFNWIPTWKQRTGMYKTYAKKHLQIYKTYSTNMQKICTICNKYAINTQIHAKHMQNRGMS